MTISNIDRAYLAGLFDGEGHIQARIGTQKSYGIFHCAAIVVNTNKDILYWIMEKTGFGNVYRRTRAKGHEDWKDSYAWHVTNMSDTIAFLELIQPYAKIKAGHIKIMLELLRQRLAIKGRHDPIKKSDVALIEAMQILNRRGK